MYQMMYSHIPIGILIVKPQTASSSSTDTETFISATLTTYVPATSTIYHTVAPIQSSSSVYYQISAAAGNGTNNGTAGPTGTGYSYAPSGFATLRKVR